MSTAFCSLALALSAQSSVQRGDAAARASAPVDFARDVLPILSDHCFPCHGPDGASRKAALRLDVRDGALSVAEPGAPDASELVRRLGIDDPRERMPPASYPRQPSADEREVLARWVAEGLAWEAHWAFAPPAAPPAAPEDPWCVDELDTYVLQGLRARGLAPSPAAERATWLRRVTFAIIGLPPSSDELDAYLADAEPDADARVVERLLASPRRAEHRARAWLDVARYADTNGFQNDFERHQWPWRDWAIGAFAANLPYDQFVTQQVAGDLLPGGDRDAVIATGFQRNHRSVTEGGSIDEEWRVEKVADRAETTATAFLGLTLGCARCHDHKFDPLSQRDYFGFYAFFDSVDEMGFYNEARGNVPPLLAVPNEAQERRLVELRHGLATGADALAALEADALPRLESWIEERRASPRADLPAPLLWFGGSATLTGPRIELPRPADERVPDDERGIDLGRSVDFERDRPFTVSFWLRPRGHGAVYSRMEDDDRYRGTDLVLLEDLRPAVHLIHAWTADAIKVIGVAPLERDRWQHVAVTYDGSSKAAGVRLLVDGAPRALEVEVDRLTGTLHADAPLRIGWRRYAGSLAGALHDFRVDSAALSVDEVQALALGRVVAVATNLESREALTFFGALDPIVAAKRRDLEALQSELTRLERDEIATVMVLRDRGEPRETRLLERGLYDHPLGDPLEPDVPSALGELPDGAPRNRLGLARWLVDPSNPLVARVAVDRVWASFFGQGLVATPEDFGTRGATPEHRALLDHLAVTFVASGYDLVALERRIALSATFRQASRASNAELERDPDNRLLARGPRRRLDAEELRDQALFVSGLLVERVGGPSVRPYQPAGLWEELAGGAGQGPYVPSTGADLVRRSLYTYRKRTVPHPTLTTFDAPGFELCTVQRSRTNTPLQALALWNDPTYVEAARHLGARMLDAANDDAARLAAGFRATLGRVASAAELDVLGRALEAHRLDYLGDGEAAAQYLAVGASAPSPAELAKRGAAEWAAFSLVAATILNLDEAVTVR